MPNATQAAVESAPAETRPDEQADKQSKRQPRYAVVLHNDNLNTFDFVINVLRKVFGYERQPAERLTHAAHSQGRAQVWVGMREHAELKADQIKSAGPDPLMAHRGAQPLRATVEPLPE